MWTEWRNFRFWRPPTRIHKLSLNSSPDTRRRKWISTTVCEKLTTRTIQENIAFQICNGQNYLKYSDQGFFYTRLRLRSSFSLSLSLTCNQSTKQGNISSKVLFKYQVFSIIVHMHNQSPTWAGHDHFIPCKGTLALPLNYGLCVYWLRVPRTFWSVVVDSCGVPRDPW